MDQIVEKVLIALDAAAVGSLRDKVTAYINLISSTGKRDPEELTTLGIAYARKIISGPDSRFSGW